MTLKTEHHILRSVPNTPLHTMRPGRPTSAPALATAGLLLIAALGCEPGSVTEARNQLNRGGERIFSLILPVTIDSAVVDDFLEGVNDTVVNGVLGVPIDQQSLSVPVIPSFLASNPVPVTAVDFAEFEDAVRDATIASSPARLRFTNLNGQVATLSNVVIGVVALNPDGSIPVDGTGAPVYDTTGAGVPRTLGVSDPGSAVITVAVGATSTIDVEAAIIVDGVVDLILNGNRPAVVVSGDGAGPLGGFLSVTIDMVALFDFFLPPEGVVLNSNTTQAGAELDTGDADQVADRVSLASFIAVATNRTAFRVDVEIAIAEGDFGETDVFGVPGSVVISSFSLDAGTVDVTGVLTAPIVDTVTIALTGAQTRPLLGDLFTASTRITLLPVSANGRAVIRPTDVVTFNARAALTIVTGEKQ